MKKLFNISLILFMITVLLSCSLNNKSIKNNNVKDIKEEEIKNAYREEFKGRIEKILGGYLSELAKWEEIRRKNFSGEKLKDEMYKSTNDIKELCKKSFTKTVSVGIPKIIEGQRIKKALHDYHRYVKAFYYNNISMFDDILMKDNLKPVNEYKNKRMEEANKYLKLANQKLKEVETILGLSGN